MEDTLTTEEVPQDRETLYNTRVVLKQFNKKYTVTITYSGPQNIQQ
jgi:hypothetical protein